MKGVSSQEAIVALKLLLLEGRKVGSIRILNRQKESQKSRLKSTPLGFYLDPSQRSFQVYPVLGGALMENYFVETSSGTAG